MKRHAIALLFTLLGAVSQAIGAGCESPKSSEEVAGCLGAELRDSDARINQSYQSLMQRLGADEQKALRTEQRGWIKERDAVCKLDTREKDRERWYRRILTDYSRTVCVTRYTRVRTAELERMLADKTPRQAAQPAAPAPQPRRDLFPKDPGAYTTRSGVNRNRGRWYWEVTVNVDEIARLQPTTLWSGCWNSEGSHGRLQNIRSFDTGYGIQELGIALDLDDGKMYLRSNGDWGNGPPGSAKGLNLKLGRTYACGLSSTIALGPLQDMKLLVINYGQAPFKYTLPDGYRALKP